MSIDLFAGTQFRQPSEDDLGAGAKDLLFDRTPFAQPQGDYVYHFPSDFKSAPPAGPLDFLKPVGDLWDKATGAVATTAGNVSDFLSGPPGRPTYYGMAQNFMNTPSTPTSGRSIRDEFLNLLPALGMNGEIGSEGSIAGKALARNATADLARPVADVARPMSVADLNGALRAPVSDVRAPITVADLAPRRPMTAADYFAAEDARLARAPEVPVAERGSIATQPVADADLRAAPVEPISLADLNARIGARPAEDVPPVTNLSERIGAKPSAAALRQVADTGPAQMAARDNFAAQVEAKQAATQGTLASSGMSGNLIGRAFGRGGSQLDRAQRTGITADDLNASLVRQAKVSQANDAFIAAAKAGDLVAAERAARTVTLLGGDLGHTWARARAAGVELPTRNEFMRAGANSPASSLGEKTVEVPTQAPRVSGGGGGLLSRLAPFAREEGGSATIGTALGRPTRGEPGPLLAGTSPSGESRIPFGPSSSSIGKAQAATSIYHTALVRNLLSPATTVLKGTNDLVQKALETVRIAARPVTGGGPAGAVPGNLAALWRPQGTLGSSLVRGFKTQAYGLASEDAPIVNTFDRLRAGDGGPIAQKIAQAVDLVTLKGVINRSLSGVTAEAQAGFRDAYIRNEGYAVAAKIGVTDRAAFARGFANYAKANPDNLKVQDLMARAQSYADQRTWTNSSTNQVVTMLRDARNSPTLQGNAAFTMLPFVNLVTNLARESAEFIPGLNVKGLLSKTDANGVALTAAQMSARRTNAAVGALAVYGLGQAAASGDLTGDGPSDPNKRNTLMDSGWKPNSVQIGGRWVENRYFGPLSALFNLVGNFHDNMLYDVKPEERGQAASIMTSGLSAAASTASDQLHWLGSISDLLDVWRNGTQKQQEDFLARLVSGYVPNSGTLKLAERMSESTSPKSANVGEYFRGQFPGSGLPPGYTRTYSGLAQLFPIGQEGPAAPTETFVGPKSGQRVTPYVAPSAKPATPKPLPTVKPRPKR